MGKDGLGGTHGPSKAENRIGILESRLSNLRMKYLGTLGLLSESSVHVPEDIRERIEYAFEDACADGKLQYRRVLNRLEIHAKE